MMVIGPSHRIRSAGEVRWAHTTAGSAATIGIDVEDQVGVIDIEAARSALGLPARLEVEG